MKRYENPYIKNIRRGVLDFIHWGLGHYENAPPLAAPEADFVYPRLGRPLNPNLPVATWIGHSTFLIEAYGKRILTDPIWSDRCSPLYFLGPKRRHAPPIASHLIPKIDIVLISHNHYDHLDEKTVRMLHERFPEILWVVPKGVKGWFTKRKIGNVKELIWWQELVENPEISITAVPAQHHSGRGVFDRNKTLWAGYVMRLFEKSFYFVGDTAYNPYDFKKIGERFRAIDLCLCPIGTYQPEEFMRTVHASPKDAVSIHIEVKARLSLGMHWKTFRLSNEPMDQPPFDLYNEMVGRGLNPMHFLPLEPGEKINW